MVEKKQGIKDFVARAEKLRVEIAGKRDELREIYDEIADELDSNDRAVDALEAAIEALSEYL